MEIKNKVFNYYIIPPSSETKGKIRVIYSPITIDAGIAREKISNILKSKKEPSIPNGPILHICFDKDSKMIYILNARSFNQETIDTLIKAAQIRITKDFGGYSAIRPIKGSPIDLIKIRSVKSFSHAYETISQHFKGREFKDLPVIEVNFDRMPSMVASLPDIFKSSGNMGGYVGRKDIQTVNFSEEIDENGKKIDNPKLIFGLPTPFILINISRGKDGKSITSSTKEWIILDSYRDYLYDPQEFPQQKKEDKDFVDIYAIKRHLYMGWPFEEVCSLFMKDVDNVPNMFIFIDRLMVACNLLEQEYNVNPVKGNYYISCKISSKFPINLSRLIQPDGKINIGAQFKHFIIIDFDNKTGQIIIQTPVFIPPSTLIRCLNLPSEPLISTYNPITNTIDIKSSSKSYEEMQRERIQMAKVKAIVADYLPPEESKELKYRAGVIALGSSVMSSQVYIIRKVSDYYFATNYIKNMCEEENVPFFDFNIVIGPIERVLGAGKMGGFMNKQSFAENKMPTPCQFDEDVWVSPPTILINSERMPSYADHATTLIHEYQHYIDTIKDPIYKPKYWGYKEKNLGNNQEDDKFWSLYYGDTQELSAHKRQIKWQLLEGMSEDEIIRDCVGGIINLRNYPVALRFAEIVKEVAKKIEEEKENEEPIEKRK